MSEDTTHPHTCTEKPEYRCHRCDEESGFNKGVNASREIVMILQKQLSAQKEVISVYQEAIDEIYNMRIDNTHMAANLMHMIARDVKEKLG